MSFCDQMAAAIDGARTLTRLDHLSRSIWQGLAAGAVGDDDAQALAERLQACRSALRGEIKPVGIPPGRSSIFPPRRLQRAPKRPVAIARREAGRLGLLTVQERRRESRRNLSNVIRIVSKEWTSWLARGGRASRPV